MVAFGFLPQNIGRWPAPMNGTLAFYECKFSGGGTMRCWGHSNPTMSVADPGFSRGGASTLK